MDELFRFIALRPAQAANNPALVKMTAQTPLQLQIGRALPTGVGRDRLIAHAQQEASKFVDATPGLWDPGATYGKALKTLIPRLKALKAPRTIKDLDAEIATAFTKPVANIVSDAAFTVDQQQALDAILAIFLLPKYHKKPLADHVEIARAASVVKLVAAQDASLATDASIAAALEATLSLPEAIFPEDPAQIQPVGVADLKVVRQHLTGYELGDLASVENILAGETRDHWSDHGLENERSTTTTTENTSSSETELSTSQRFDLKREATNTQKEDISVKAGVSASYKYGDSLEINANVDVAYSNAKEQTTKQSQEYAKDVTQRAISKVSSRIQQTVSSKILETQSEHDRHKFENKAAAGSNATPANISGIYQWINQVSEAQVFNYGKRLLFDLIIPEPAAFLIDAATIAAKAPDKDSLPPPDPLVVDASVTPQVPLTPNDLSLKPTDKLYYGKLLSKYRVSSAKAPKAQRITVSKSISAVNGDPLNGDITIPDGYVADVITVVGIYNYSDSGATGLNVFVGDKLYHMGNQSGVPMSAKANGEVQSIAYAVETDRIANFGLTVEVACDLQQSAMDQWRIDTFNAIVTGYTTLLSEYQDRQDSRPPEQAKLMAIGGNPGANKIRAMSELKKSAIALISKKDLVGAVNGIQEKVPPVQSTNPGAGGTTGEFPRPYPAAYEDNARLIRFFEQAFEWEQMMYFLYPYYWGREWTWYAKVGLAHTDPEFQKFLTSGAARVVIPVRRSMEGDLRYFLITGQLWSGGAMPDVTDKNYLPITEEIKEADHAPGSETPDGPSWQVRVPTSLIKLRSDNALPGWTRSGVWDWTASPKDA